MTIIIDPQGSGIAGNMLIGAFVDLGADANELKEIMEKSAHEFGKVNVTFEKVSKHGIASTFCHVEMLEHKHSINFPEFIEKINNLDLDEKVKETSIKVLKDSPKLKAKFMEKHLKPFIFMRWEPVMQLQM